MHLISCLDENKGKYDILDAKKTEFCTICCFGDLIYCMMHLAHSDMVIRYVINFLSASHYCLVIIQSCYERMIWLITSNYV